MTPAEIAAMDQEARQQTLQNAANAASMLDAFMSAGFDREEAMQFVIAWFSLVTNSLLNLREAATYMQMGYGDVD